MRIVMLKSFIWRLIKVNDHSVKFYVKYEWELCVFSYESDFNKSARPSLEFYSRGKGSFYVRIFLGYKLSQSRFY